MIVYDNQSRAMLQPDQQFLRISSQRKDLRVDDKGSIDVYLGPKPPVQNAHLIQTEPGRGWNTTLRLNRPLETRFYRSSRPGEIELVE